jgi:hypothetical protein
MAGVATAVLLALAAPARAETVCRIRYQASGWSFFYKTASGTGHISCDNGQRADVAIRVVGGGPTVGITEITGKGTFSAVPDIGELFGEYGSAVAHAGVIRSGEAHVVTKGPVSLGLAGTGRGIDVGISFGKFEILPRGGHRHATAPPGEPDELRPPADEQRDDLRRDDY